MFYKLQKVMRGLLTFIHRECGKQSKRSGGLMINVSALSDSPPTVTVSAAGAWCHKISKSAQNEAMESLSLPVPPCQCIHQEELQRFTDSFGCLYFTYSFHVGEADTQSVEVDRLNIERFLHQLSLVHAQVKIIFEMRTDSKTHQQIFSGETGGSKVSVMNQSIAMDSAAYGQSPFSVRCRSSCPQIHPVLGDTLCCLLPTDTVEAGLCGEMSIATVAMLGPCMNQYPNWPIHLSCIRMVVYSPCGMPLMMGQQQMQKSFLQSLATSLSWADLGITKVCCVDTQTIQGSMCSEIEFSVETDHSQETESGCSGVVHQNFEPEGNCAVEQTLTLFILTQYTDPFHSQLSEVISSEEVLERHLDAVLWHNGERVRESLQSTLKVALKGFQKRKTNRQRLQSALSVVLSSVSSIVTSSASAGFRRACFDSMMVKSTCELRTSLRRSLQRVVDCRFAPRRTCHGEKVAEAASSEPSSLESWEEAFENSPELSPKRIQSDLESSCFIPKKRLCSELFSENSDASRNSVFEQANIQRSPLSPIQFSQNQRTEIVQDDPSDHSPSLVKLKNEQVQRQWLEELENFSEWD